MTGALGTLWRLALLGGLLAVLVAAGLVPALSRVAMANGVPTLVQLSYLDGLSNWGPEDATGEVELAFGEGRATLTADGLPRLETSRYQGWLVNSESNDAISIGRFDADAAGHVLLEATLPPIADFGFDLFIVTVEPEPDDAPQPTAERSIGGFFALVGQPPSDGSGETGTSGEIGLPTELPNTGDPTFFTDVGRLGLLAAVMGLSLFVGLRLGRRNA
jgi:hypothetical protein